MRTWGSRVLRASSRAGMRRGAWGFNLAPAVLLTFTRVWILRERNRHNIFPKTKGLLGRRERAEKREERERLDMFSKRKG